MDMDEGQRLAVLQSVIDLAKLDMEWFGTGGLGIVLVHRHYSHDTAISAAELASHSPLSEAQVRRRLHRLIEEGKVTKVEWEGRHLYWVDPVVAERYAKAVAGIVGVHLTA